MYDVHMYMLLWKPFHLHTCEYVLYRVLHFKGCGGREPFFIYVASTWVSRGFVMAGLDWIVQEQIFASSRESTLPKQVWETGWFKQIFAQGSNETVDRLTKKPRLEALKPEGQQEYVTPTPSVTIAKPVSFVKQRLLLARLIKTEDTIRHGALRKLRLVILEDVEQCGLGKTLKQHAGNFSDESTLHDTFNSVFVNKATATLVKRANFLWAFQAWCNESGIASVFHAEEADVCSYLEGMRDSGRGATVGKQFLQSLTFIYHMTDADKSKLAAIMSMRVRGIADGMLALKPPLKQAVPFTTDVVYKLESLMFHLQEDHLKVICGHILFCTYSCARFGDTVYLDGLNLTSTTNLWLVEAMSKRYKMGNSEKKRQFLPLVALGKGLHERPWAVPWFQARAACGLEQMVITMPAWSDATEKWIDRPMTTGEGITFLRELIGLTGMWDEAYQFTCHSAKATVLSWMAKSNQMDFNSRRLLGHHMASDASSTLTYSRDEMIRLHAQVHHVLQLIKNAEFDPDLTRVERLGQLIGVDVFDESIIPEGEDEKYEQSDLEDSDLDEDDVEFAQRCEEMEFCTDDSNVHEGFVMHSVSSVVHVLARDGRLMCGRTVGSTYGGIPKTIVVSSLPFCGQCEKGKLERLLAAQPSKPLEDDESFWYHRGGDTESSQQDSSRWNLVSAPSASFYAISEEEEMEEFHHVK